MEAICGIYMIKNTVNGKIYIGKSFDIKKRWSNHKYELNKGIHVNNHLQSAWNKYGESCFEFIIVEECNEDDLSNKEIYWIKETDAYYNGYNQTEGGEGSHLPEEVKAKIGAAAKEWWSNPENKSKMSEARKGEGNFWYGKTFPDDMIQKLSESHKNPSEEIRKKQSEAHKGKKLSEETKNKISKATKGREVSEETRKKMSDAKTGRKEPWAREVYCIELNQVFRCAKDASIECSITYSNIYMCLNGERKSAGKHPVTGEKLHWVYVDEWQVAS